MKALSIEEIKQLKNGDWVWIVDTNANSYYAEVIVITTEVFAVISSSYKIPAHLLQDYGKTWVAYKNKEQAECDNSYDLLKVKYEIVLKEYAKLKRKATKYNFMTKTIDKEITKQAEQKLKEL